MYNTCVVVAHGRTGSSLLMQTLNLLGMPCVGSIHREDLPVYANPKGYFEDRLIMDKGGITQENIKRVNDFRGKACKVPLYRMIKEDCAEQWQRLESAKAKLFIPFRHPVESAISQKALFNNKNTFKSDFFLITKTLCVLIRDYKELSKILVQRVPYLKQRTLHIPYTSHIVDPARFVEQVRQHAEIPPDQPRLAAALKNIDPLLYRYKADNFPAEYHDWYNKMPIKRIHDLLTNTTDHSVWDKILELS